MGIKVRHWGLVAAIILPLGGGVACDDNGTGIAAEGKPATPDDTMAVPGAIRDLILSDDLYQHGVRNRDALALALAAKIRSSTNVKEVDGAADQGAVMRPYGAQRMMEEALELAGGAPAVMALVDEVKALSSKGREPRPLFLPMELAPGEVRDFDETFEAKKIAALYVRSEKDAPFSIVVSDDDGTDLCRHERVHPKALCYWRSGQRASYRIRISNVGDDVIGLSMYTN